jgi:hypothetical protein
VRRAGEFHVRETWWLFAKGAGLLLAAVVLMAVPYQQGLARADAYRSARPCSSTAGPRDHNCRRTVDAVVTSTKVGNARSVRWYVHVSGSRSVRGTIVLTRDEPVFSRLHTGDRVQVTLWHGSRTAIRFGSRTQETIEAPDTPPNAYLGFAVGLVILGGLVIRPVFGGGDPDSWSYAERCLFAFALYSILSGVILAEGHHDNPGTYFLIWTCLGAGWAIFCWLGSLWDRRHGVWWRE